MNNFTSKQHYIIIVTTVYLNINVLLIHILFIRTEVKNIFLLSKKCSFLFVTKPRGYHINQAYRECIHIKHKSGMPEI